MNKKERYNTLYMDIAYRVSEMSHCVRKKVGAIAVKDGRIISMGWNGTPAGWDNCCEDATEDGLVTKDAVLHAESNLLMKLAQSHESAEGCDIYITCAPCIHCAKLLYQAGMKTVYFDEIYRTTCGIDFLNECDVEVHHIGE